MGTSPKHYEACLKANKLISDRAKQKYEENPKQCKKCEGPIPWDKRSRLYCSDDCLKNSGTRGGSVAKPRPPCSNPNCSNLCPSRKNKYCGHSCSAEHRSILVRDGWILGGETPGPGTIRKYLKGIRDECWCCGISEWNDKPIVLEIEHTDGNADNNNPDNLELLCPNCHSQTDTWKARNRGNGRVLRRERAKKDYHRAFDP